MKVAGLLLWSSKLFETAGGTRKLFSKLTSSLPILLAYHIKAWHSQGLSTQRALLHLLHSLQNSYFSFLFSFALFSSLPEFQITLFDAILLLSLNRVNFISLGFIDCQVLLATWWLRRLIGLWTFLFLSRGGYSTVLLGDWLYLQSQIFHPDLLMDARSPQSRQHPWCDLNNELCIQYPSNSTPCTWPFFVSCSLPPFNIHPLIPYNHS